MYFSILYSLQGFLDKNRDLMRPDILSVLKNSNSRFIRDLLGKRTDFAYMGIILFLPRVCRTSNSILIPNLFLSVTSRRGPFGYVPVVNFEVVFQSCACV